MRALSHFLIQQANWQFPLKLSRQPDPNLTPWLFYPGSLTKQLKQLTAANGLVFNIEVLGQHRRLAFQDEQFLLAENEVFLIREVLLKGNEVPLVLARTVIPLRSLTGPYRRLGWLKSKSLGSVLFRYSQPQRKAFQLTMLERDQLNSAFDLNSDVWGRRSLYDSKGHSFLVAEFFLPTLLNLQNR